MRVRGDTRRRRIHACIYVRAACCTYPRVPVVMHDRRHEQGQTVRAADRVGDGLDGEEVGHCEGDVGGVHVRVVRVGGLRGVAVAGLDAQEHLTQPVHAQPERPDDVVVREGGHRREP